jgi:hypothetical protein
MKADKKLRLKGDRKISIEKRTLIALEYVREYRPYLSIGIGCGLSAEKLK